MDVPFWITSLVIPQVDSEVIKITLRVVCEHETWALMTRDRFFIDAANNPIAIAGAVEYLLGQALEACGVAV